MSSIFLPPKTKIMIGRTVRSANLRPGYIWRKTALNSCPDSDLRNTLTLVVVLVMMKYHMA